MEYVQIASAVLSVMGAISGGQQRSAQYEAQQRANEYNAAVGRQRAESALQVSNVKEDQQRREAAFIIGKQRAASAQAGLGLSGSAADVERQSEVMAELDALNIRYEGQMKAHGYLAGAAQEDYAGSVAGYSASSARSGGYLAAATRALAGGADYMRMKSPTYSDRPTLDGGADLADS